MTGSAVVHVVDDDPTVLKSLTRLISSAGLAAHPHADARQFLDDCDPHSAGCVVLDRQMPGLDGHAVQNWLRERGACLPVIFLTGEGDIASSVQAMKAGAIEYLTKPIEPDLLLQTVRRALALDQMRRDRRAEQDGFAKRLRSLSTREREVLECAVRGLMNKQIAHDLNIVESTVKVHRARVMKKMEAKSFADLVSMVVQHRTDE